jgi:hypothetical protein
MWKQHFLPTLGGTIWVYKVLSTTNMVLDDSYNCSDFNMELKVEFNGVTSNWLCLKISGIPNSGLGIFALRAFKKKEFITAYLGKIKTDILETDFFLWNQW